MTDDNNFLLCRSRCRMGSGVSVICVDRVVRSYAIGRLRPFSHIAVSSLIILCRFAASDWECDVLIGNGSKRCVRVFSSFLLRREIYLKEWDRRCIPWIHAIGDRNVQQTHSSDRSRQVASSKIHAGGRLTVRTISKDLQTQWSMEGNWKG